MSFEWTNKQDGDIILADDINTIANNLPTKTSQLENDSGYITPGDIPGYIATESYVNDKLSEYLPLSGGSVSGELLFVPALELKSENTGYGYNKSIINAVSGGGDILELRTYYLNASGYKARINFDSHGILIDGYEGSGEVRIKDISTPTDNTDAANKKYVDDKYTVLSQSEYDAITEKEPDKIYFVYEDET